MDINGCSVTQIQCHCFLEETSLLNSWEMSWPPLVPPSVAVHSEPFHFEALISQDLSSPEEETDSANQHCWLMHVGYCLRMVELRKNEMRWVHHSCFCSTIYIIYYINIYDYIVANHRIICSMYSNHKDQFITTLWTCLYSFLSSGLEVAAEFGWSKWPRCCGHLGSGATEDPGILATWDLQNFCSHFLDLNWILPWTVKIPWFDEVENWPRFLGVFTCGFQEASLVWGLQWQKNRPSGWPVWPAGNRSARTASSKLPINIQITFSHLDTHLILF